MKKTRRKNPTRPDQKQMWILESISQELHTLGRSALSKEEVLEAVKKYGHIMKKTEILALLTQMEKGLQCIDVSLNGEVSINDKGKSFL